MANKMHITRQETARAVAKLMPSIIQGAHLGFLAEQAMTQTQFLVLLSIHAKGSCPMTKVAANMRVQIPTMTRMVDRLVKGGFLVRVHNPKDRRQVVIALAGKGKEFIVQFQNIIARRWEEVLKILKPQELSAFHLVIHKLYDDLTREKK